MNVIADAIYLPTCLHDNARSPREPECRGGMTRASHNEFNTRAAKSRADGDADMFSNILYW